MALERHTLFVNIFQETIYKAMVTFTECVMQFNYRLNRYGGKMGICS